MWWKNLPVNHWLSKRRIQTYLIFILSFLYFEGRGLYMEAITINQETILSSKRGGYHSMIETWQCVIRVSVYVADIIADIKWKNFQCKRPSQSRRYFDLLALIFFTKIPLWMYSLKAEEGSLWLSPLLSSNSNLLFALSNISKGGHSPINAGPFSAIVVFSPIDYVLKGRSHDFYKKYYLEIESNSFAFLHFSLGVVKVHLWSQTINMCNKKTDWCANWSSCLKMFSWLSKNIPALTKL